MGLMKKIKQEIQDLKAEIENKQEQIKNLTEENQELFDAHVTIHSAIEKTLASRDDMLYIIQKVLLKNSSSCLYIPKEREKVAIKLTSEINEYLIKINLEGKI